MPDELPFRLALVALLGLTGVIRAYYQLLAGFRGTKKALRRNRLDTVLVLSAVLVYGLGLLAYVVLPGSVQWAALALPVELRWSGLLLGLSTLPLFVWAHRVLGTNFSFLLRIREGHGLVTGGPYGWIRHPIYLVAVTQGLAYFVISANALLALAWLGGVILLIAYRIPREEAGLIERFGKEYRDYMDRTGRLIPRMRTRNPIVD
jgi:protein-S-isoprenylcysteine O-methyltransferase Ste14